MKTINKIALSTVFSANQIDALIEVAEATQNPQIAIELLLGVYEEPYIAKHVSHPDKGTLTFIAYDKFRDEICYSFQRQKEKGIYVDKEVDKSLVNVSNYKEYEKSCDSNTKHIWVKLDEWETAKGQCSYSSWNGYDECLV